MGSLGVSGKIANQLFRNNFSNTNFLCRHFFKSGILHGVIPFKLSDIGEGIREVVIKEWYINIGDKVAQFDNICEVQSDKSSATITSRYDGVIKKIYYDIDSLALVGSPLVDIETDAEGDGPSQTPSEENRVPQDTSDVPSTNVEPVEILQDDYILCIPSVRRLAKEFKINLNQVKGSGKHGKILKEDVLKYLNSTKEKKVVANDDDRIEPIKGFQKAMMETMTDSLAIPHFVYSDEIKITKLSEIRRSLNSKDLKIKMSFMPFFIKSVSNALAEFPLLNSVLDEKCENIIFKKNHNIGIAMDTKLGLAVPVIKDVQNKSIHDIAQEMKRLMKNGKDGQFSIADLSNGTFTISNIGVIGGTYTKPVILRPQVSIIAIGSKQILPRYDEAMNLIPEEIINLSASADHRIIDGATMAHFINKLKKYLENPYLLLLKS